MKQINMKDGPDAGYTFQQIVNKMTNYERNQWARAGYPGLRMNSFSKVAEFCPAAYRRLTGAIATLAEVLAAGEQV